MNELRESEINIISTHSKIEGKVTFDRITRIHGTIIGDIEMKSGSHLVLMETSVVEGNISADHVSVEGFVKGNIRARTEVILAPNARVFGNVRAPSVRIAAGSLFDGKCMMEEERRPTAGSQVAPA